MKLLNRLFGKGKLDGAQLAHSDEKGEYAQIDLLSHFVEARPRHEHRDELRWNRVLARPYAELLEEFVKAGWLTAVESGYQATEIAIPFIQAYEARMEAERVAVLPKAQVALAEQDSGTALELRRAYESLYPLGKAPWTGPEPQLSHSALTRRILFLDHPLLEGLSEESTAWLKLYAAEQHLWGAYWRLNEDEIPGHVQDEITAVDLDGNPMTSADVDNQETWQRCKGGDHVRRIEVAGPDDEYTCEQCREFLNQEFLVVRVPELPPQGCTSPRGCLCRYEPVLSSYSDL